MRSCAGGAPSFGAPPFCGRGRAGTPVDPVGARFQHAPSCGARRGRCGGVRRESAWGHLDPHCFRAARGSAVCPALWLFRPRKVDLLMLCALSRAWGEWKDCPYGVSRQAVSCRLIAFVWQLFRSVGRSVFTSYRRIPSSSYIFPNVCITGLSVEVQLRILRDSPGLKKGSGAMSSARRRAKRRKGRAYGQRRPAQPGRSGNPA